MKKVVLFLLGVFVFGGHVYADAEQCTMLRSRAPEMRKQIASELNQYDFEALEFGVIEKAKLISGGMAYAIPEVWFFEVWIDGKKTIIEKDPPFGCFLYDWWPQKGDTIILIKGDEFTSLEKEDLFLKDKKAFSYPSKVDDAEEHVENAKSKIAYYRPKVTHHYEIFSEEIYKMSKFKDIALPQSGGSNNYYWLFIGLFGFFLGNKLRKKCQK